MLTYYETQSQENRERQDKMLGRQKADIEAIRLTNPYQTVKTELNVVSTIDKELGGERKQRKHEPTPIPSKTGYSYEQWRQNKELHSKMNKASVQLSMRIAQREKLHLKKNTKSNFQMDYETGPLPSKKY